MALQAARCDGKDCDRSAREPYRVYYAIADKKIVLLLCGGDKLTQDADIDPACEYWQDWQRRTNDER